MECEVGIYVESEVQNVDKEEFEIFVTLWMVLPCWVDFLIAKVE